MQKIVLFFAFNLLSIHYLFGQSSQVIKGVVSPEVWIVNSFAKSKIPPFSFEYGGKPSGGFIMKWKHTIQKGATSEDGVIAYTVTYSDPASKLKVRCDIKGMPRFQAVEWVLHFSNENSQNSAGIKNVKALDLSLVYENASGYTLYHSEGSDHNINDFRLHTQPMEGGASRHMEPQSGRSSDKTAFPFFNVEGKGKGGVIVSVGWTGTWFADVANPSGKGVQLSAGMKYFDLYLLPGESVRTPMITLSFWEGTDFVAGHNQFRQFVLNHHSRKIDGRFAEYPLSGGFEWGDPWPCNEYSCLNEQIALAFISRYKQFKLVPEVFWLDAGWYVGSGGPTFDNKNWYNTVGTWRADPERFPNGLKPIGEAAKAAGSKFMVWFEPERVMSGSELATKYPQWMLKRPGEDNIFLFDLGNTEAREWLSKYIGDFLEANSIDYYRQDFNMPIQPYWVANEEPGRTGIREIRHIEGLYAFWDYLLKRFPELLIDNCASGGRRLDLETASRSAPLWRTDYQYGEPNGYQNHTYGLHFYLPLHGTGVFGIDKYSFHSALSSAMVINWELTGRQGNLREMQKYVQQFKELRPYYYSDYYPLTGLGDLSTMDVWLAYQFNRPEDQSGMVVAFRRKDQTSDKLTVQLKGLQPDKVYHIGNIDDDKQLKKTGRELSEGFAIEIKEAPGSVVFRYGVAN